MLKPRATGIAVCVVIAAGLAYWFLWKPASNIAAQRDAVEKHVQSLLKDPDSAKFRSVQFFQKSKAGCGEVNAKNSMGGYVGYTAFVKFDDGDVRFEPKDERDSEAAARARNFWDLVAANCPEWPPQK